MDWQNKLQQFTSRPSTRKITFKLLIDLLFIMLIAFLLLLMAESIAPGVVTLYLSLTKILVIISLILLLTIYVGRKAQIDFKLELKKNNQALVVVLLLIAAISFNSLLNFQGWQNILISIATTAIIFLFYKILLAKED